MTEEVGCKKRSTSLVIQAFIVFARLAKFQFHCVTDRQKGTWKKAFFVACNPIKLQSVLGIKTNEWNE